LLSVSVETAFDAIDPVLSSTNMMSVLGRRISASQVTASVSVVLPKIRISVIGSAAEAVPETLPAFSLNARVTASEP
jgi:hypothetical protein